jgi:hypothetical protein
MKQKEQANIIIQEVCKTHPSLAKIIASGSHNMDPLKPKKTGCMLAKIRSSAILQESMERMLTFKSILTSCKFNIPTNPTVKLLHTHRPHRYPGLKPRS